MAFKDIREFISKLEEQGEVIRIAQEVDWNLEVGAILRRACEQRLSAPLFQRIKGYPEGYRMFGGTLASHRRVAIAMGMDPETPYRVLMEEYLRRKESPIKPRIIKDAPCKENIHIGDEVDLFEFPAPLLHEGDGGRYLCTWHLNITKDPDTPWVNWGMYRAMVHSRNMLTGLLLPYQHIGLHYYGKYEPRNQPMPVAIAIGTEPICAFIASTFLPAGVSEVDVAGAVRGEPVELVKCETIDLEVPATSEIVIEAEVPPRERVMEGLFGEFTGYMAGTAANRPVFKVKAITHRNNPILTVSCMGVPIDDSHASITITKGAEILKLLRDEGYPIVDLYCPPEFSQMMVIVSIRVLYANLAYGVASAIWGSHMGRTVPYVVVVDDDVDPTDMDQVMHALVTKCHPFRGINKFERTRGMALSPFLNRHERQHNIGANVYFDCTWPVDWDPEDVPRRASFDSIYPKELQEHVLKNWMNYGFKEL